MKPNPFLTIWLRPRETIRRIVKWNPNYCVIWLACLAGIAENLDTFSAGNAGDKYPSAMIIAIALVMGPLVGLVLLWINSLLIRWTGKWIGGTASRKTIRTALAWSCVPTAFALLLIIPKLLIAGPELFKASMPHLDSNPCLWIPFAVLDWIEVVLVVWSFVTLCHTVAEVQGYRSAWRGLGNFLLVGVVSFAAFLAFGLVILAVVFLGGGFKHVVHG